MTFRTRERLRLETFVRSLYIPHSEETLRQTIVGELLKIVPGQNAILLVANLLQG